MTHIPVGRRDLEFFLEEVLGAGAPGSVIRGCEPAAAAGGDTALEWFCAYLREQKAAPGEARRLHAGLLLDLIEPIANARPGPQENASSGIEISAASPALDLLGGEMARQGAALRVLGREIEMTCRDAGALRQTVMFARQLAEAAARAILTTEKLLEAGGPGRTPARAALYLRMFRQVVSAWLWLRQATVAARRLAEDGPESDFYRGKLRAAADFFHQELPKSARWCELLLSPEAAILDPQLA